MDIDMVNSRETKEHFKANQLKKKCKKEISKESITDSYEIQNSVVEYHRDEELCRRWDALADEDHTDHLTAQEYLYYKSKWWLHSNKQGSNTMTLRHRPDFKHALSTLQRLQQEAGEEPHVPPYSYKHQKWETRSSSSPWWNWQGSWWTPYHSESQNGDAPSIE